MRKLLKIFALMIIGLFIMYVSVAVGFLVATWLFDLYIPALFGICMVFGFAGLFFFVKLVIKAL